MLLGVETEWSQRNSLPRTDSLDKSIPGKIYLPKEYGYLLLRIGICKNQLFVCVPYFLLMDLPSLMPATDLIFYSIMFPHDPPSKNSTNCHRVFLFL